MPDANYCWKETDRREEGEKGKDVRDRLAQNTLFLKTLIGCWCLLGAIEN